VLLSTQGYKSKMGTGKLGGNPEMDEHPIQGGVEILLVASCYRNWDTRWPDRLLGSYVDFSFSLYRLLNEKVTPKSLLFLSSPIANKHSDFPLTKVSTSKVLVILKKEAQNLTLKATILKLYMAARRTCN